MTWELAIAGLFLVGVYLYMNQGSDNSSGVTGNFSVKALASAIQTFEGFYPGSRSYRNNNPGNLKFASQPGAVAQDDKGFAVFDSYTSGWNALIALIYRRIQQHPTWTVLDFFMSYAPPSDNNPTQQYAQTVADAVGASTSTQLQEFV